MRCDRPVMNLILLLLIISSPRHINASYKKINSAQWKPGLYVEYIERFSGESGSGWTGYRFTLKDKNKNGLWQMEMSARSRDFEYLFTFDVREPDELSLLKDGETAITNVIITPWRNGTPDVPEQIQRRTEIFFNALKLLHSADAGAADLSRVKTIYPHGIRPAAVIERVEHDTFHKRYFVFSSDVPVFGLAGVEADDGSFELKVTAFGTTENHAGKGGIQSYIDFDNREKIHYGDFHIDLPATWFLQEIKNGASGTKLYKGYAGGKDLGAAISILYRAGTTPADISSQLKLYGNNMSEGKTRYRLLRTEGYEDATHNAKFFYHLYESSGATGFSVTGVLSSKKGDRMAVPRINVSFSSGNPGAENATSYLKQCSDIVRSFRIEGL